MDESAGGADAGDDRGVVGGDGVAFVQQPLSEAAAGERVLLLGDHGKSEQRTGGGRLGEVIVGGVRVERLGFPRRGDRLFDDFGDRIDALIFRGDAADEGGQVVDGDRSLDRKAASASVADRVQGSAVGWSGLRRAAALGAGYRCSCARLGDGRPDPDGTVADFGELTADEFTGRK